jgi:hypothetical protein
VASVTVTYLLAASRTIPLPCLKSGPTFYSHLHSTYLPALPCPYWASVACRCQKLEDVVQFDGKSAIELHNVLHVPYYPCNVLGCISNKDPKAACSLCSNSFRTVRRSETSTISGNPRTSSSPSSWRLARRAREPECVLRLFGPTGVRLHPLFCTKVKKHLRRCSFTHYAGFKQNMLRSTPLSNSQIYPAA